MKKGINCVVAKQSQKLFELSLQRGNFRREIGIGSV